MDIGWLSVVLTWEPVAADRAELFALQLTDSSDFWPVGEYRGSIVTAISEIRWITPGLRMN